MSVNKFIITCLLVLSNFCYNDAKASQLPLQIAEQEEKTSTIAYPVGELGDRWQFPSDHLPVGGTAGNVHFAVWNTLNTDYLRWIENNSQGLRDSLIMQANIPSSGTLTLREEMVVESIFKMLTHPTYPRSVLALQELNENVYNEIQNRLITTPSLSESHRLFPSPLKERIEDIFIVDTAKFDVLDYEYVRYSFKQSTMVKLTLIERETDLIYCFIQSHIPGGPIDSIPARVEFAEYVLRNYDPEAITILLGDMNRSPDFFLPNFEKAAKRYHISPQPFKIMEIPYPTHVDTHMLASWIDNVFICNPYDEVFSKAAAGAAEFFDSMQIAIDLLENPEISLEEALAM